ncbi:MAG: hypothetical protein ACI81W_000594, partial [Saprospiraceae bacterium]
MKNLKLFTAGLFGLLLFLSASCTPEKKEVVVNTIRPVKYGTVVMSGDASSETFSGTAQSSKETKLSFKVGG